MADHYEEEAEAEQLKQWWKENWKSLLLGLVLGLAVIMGWEGYQRYQLQQADQASQMYEDLKAAVTAHKADDAIALGDKLASAYSRTPYAASAALYLAQQAVELGKFDDAATRLQWAIDHGRDANLKELARLRLAKVLWQIKKTDEALKLLDGDHGSFNALCAELRGDIKLSQNDRAGARADYEQAMTSAEGASRELLQRKLDDLADVVKS